MTTTTIYIKTSIESDVASLDVRELEVQNKKIVILHISLKRAISPEDLKTIRNMVQKAGKVASVLGADCVVLSGRGPVWLYGALAHALHGLAKAIAVLDPKIPGAIVIASHHPYISEYTVLQLPEQIIQELVQLETPGSK